MSNFRNRLRQWKSRAIAVKSKSKSTVQNKDGYSRLADDHHHGAEGHAFQVNNHPQEVDDQADDAP